MKVSACVWVYVCVLVCCVCVCVQILVRYHTFLSPFVTIARRS